MATPRPRCCWYRPRPSFGSGSEPIPARKSATTPRPSPSRLAGGSGSFSSSLVSSSPLRWHLLWPNIIPVFLPAWSSASVVSPLIPLAIKQGKLPAERPAKRRGGKFRPVVFDARPAARDGKKRLDLFGKNPFARHPFAEPGVVKCAAVHRPDPIQNLLLLLRELAFQ